MINYFFRFFITFSSRIANASDVLSALRRVFILYSTSKTIYCDREQHFNNQNVTRFLKSHEISYSFSSSDSSQSIDMIKIENRLLKDILRKSKSQSWQNVLDQVTRNLNNRIIRHLEVFFAMILMRISSSTAIVDSTFQVLINIISAWIDQLMNVFSYETMINKFLKTRQRLQSLIFERSQHRKDVEIRKYNKNIQEHNFTSDDLIMIYQKNTKKFESRWRDSFRVKKIDTREVSYSLHQLNERHIKRTFHDNHLKSFISRIDHLASFSNISLSTNQTIRKSKKRTRRVASIISAWDRSLYSHFRLIFVLLSTDSHFVSSWTLQELNSRYVI